jgi:hypothetical protein
MTRRWRRPRTEPTAGDLARWRRLVRVAIVQAGRPLHPSGDLQSAAARAVKAVIPGPASNDSPFVQLVRLAQRWPGMGPEVRSNAAETLKSLAARCRLVLDPPPAPTRIRADLEG